jgi:cell division protein FtsW
MTCVAMGLLLRVSYELNRAERHVALRGEAPAPAAAPETCPTLPLPASLVRGTSRLKSRIEPSFERIA